MFLAVTFNNMSFNFFSLETIFAGSFAHTACCWLIFWENTSKYGCSSALQPVFKLRVGLLASHNLDFSILLQTPLSQNDYYIIKIKNLTSLLNHHDSSYMNPIFWMVLLTKSKWLQSPNWTARMQHC